MSSGVTKVLVLSKKTQQVLESVARDSYPHEAVGLIDGAGNVWELTNTHKHPESGFEISRDDIRAVVEQTGFNGLSEATIWHSHPSGGVGPSRVDLQNKSPFKYHLVVTLTDGGIILTWY